MHATLFYEFQRLCLGFFCIFFISMMRLGLQDRRSENILNLVPNHHTPFILSKFTSYKFGLSYLFFFPQMTKIIWIFQHISCSKFLQNLHCNMCLKCFRQSQFQFPVCVFNRKFQPCKKTNSKYQQSNLAKVYLCPKSQSHLCWVVGSKGIEGYSTQPIIQSLWFIPSCGTIIFNSSLGFSVLLQNEGRNGG